MNTATDNVTPINGQNTISGGVFQPFVARHEIEQAKIDAIMEKARKECQPHRDNQKTIKDEAADKGFRKQPFAALIKKRKLIRKANDIEAKLADEQKEDYEQMHDACSMQLVLDLPDVKAA